MRNGSASIVEPPPKPRKPPTSAQTRVAATSATTGLPESAFMIGQRNALTDAWSFVYEDLRRLSILPDDWDGLGAKAPSRAHLDTALKIVETHRKRGNIAPSRVVAGTDGAVIIEWQAEGFYADMEIIEPYCANVMLKISGQDAQHWTLSPGDFE